MPTASAKSLMEHRWRLSKVFRIRSRVFEAMFVGLAGYLSKILYKNKKSTHLSALIASIPVGKSGVNIILDYYHKNYKY
jgi:hypothetical protein